MVTLDVFLLFVLLLAVGGAVKGLLGVGLPMVAIPGLTLVVGLPNALAMIGIPLAASNLWQVWQYRKAPGPGGILGPYLVAGALGVMSGTFILVSLPEAVLEVALASMLVGYIVLRLRNPGLRMIETAARKTAPPIGFAAGVIHGATGIAGPIGLTYFHAQRLTRERFILCVGLMFLCFSLVQIPMLGLTGVLRGDAVVAGILGLPAVAAGLWVGNALGRRVDARIFDRLVLIVLAWTAGSLLWRAGSSVVAG